MPLYVFTRTYITPCPQRLCVSCLEHVAQSPDTLSKHRLLYSVSAWTKEAVQRANGPSWHGIMKSSSPMPEWYLCLPRLHPISSIPLLVLLPYVSERCGGEHGTGVDGGRSRSSHGIFADDHLSLAAFSHCDVPSCFACETGRGAYGCHPLPPLKPRSGSLA